MNLSNRLTFSLIFSVLLLTAGIIFAPTAMAAEGGPAVMSLVLDDSMTVGHAGNATSNPVIAAVGPAAVVSDGNALLTAPEPTGLTTAVPGNRVILLDVGNAIETTTGAGFFRLLLTFDQDVYNANTAKPDAPGDPDTALHDQSTTRTYTATDLADDDFTILSALSIVTGTDQSANVSVSSVTRVLTADPTPANGASGDEVYSLRQFYVELTVTNAGLAGLPINIAIALEADAGVFGIGTNRQITPFVAAEVGLGNEGYVAPGSPQQPYTQYDFQVIARAVSALTVETDYTTPTIKSSDRVTLTLMFDPALHDSDVPTRTNIMVDGGSILPDDPATTNDDGTPMDDGFYEVPPAEGSDPPDPADNTQWKIVIVPDGGTGVLQRMITVSNAPGAAFTLNQVIMVDDRTPTTPTPTQDITITGTAPADGAVFTATITYTIAPAVALTEAGVSVTNGTKVAGTFAGSGSVYTIDIDPNNPTVDNPVTVTVSVGQFSQTFTTNATPPPTPVDPNEPTVITLGVGVNAGDYLVVAPMGATSQGTANSALPSSVTPTMVSDMPNLWSLLFSGGTISVYVTADSDGNTADIVINEVMWARDEGAIGQAGEVLHQWIELYNNSSHDATGGSITLQFRPKVAPAALTDKGTRTDRLSNIERVGATTGWRISSGKGQNGNSTTGSLKEFISMYRQGNKLGDNDGVNGGHWHQSTELSHVNHKGTPGAVNTTAEVPVTTRPTPPTFTPPKSHVLINEVHNNANNDFDWLELRFLQRTRILNWTLSYAKSDFTEVEIMRFPDRWFNAGDIVLIVNKGPQDTDLVAGQDVTVGAANQARGAGPHMYWNPSGGNSGSGHYLDIPDYNGGNFFLILRSPNGWDRLNGSRDKMHDVAGPANFSRKTLNANTVAREPNTNGNNPDFIWETNVWPINGQNLRAHNANGSNNDNAFLQPDRKFSVGSVWARSGTRHGWRKDGGYYPGNRGGLGYDRNVVANGTPGYDNDILKGKSTDLAGGTVVVSELMLTTDSGRFPQWIELHNTSNNTVDLHADTDGNGARLGWSIRVENHKSGSWDNRRRDRLNVEVNFRQLGVRFIPPNQTILIVADKVRNSNADYFPDHRVASIWATANGQFKMASRRDTFLNPNGFLLQIVDGNGLISDAVGNLDGVTPDLFNNAGFDNPYGWEWPAEDDMVVNNRRTSLIRIYDDSVPRMGTPDRDAAGSKRGAVLPLGIEHNRRGEGEITMGMDDAGNPIKVPAKYAGYAWIHTSDTKLAHVQVAWYGSEDDYATPLQTAGTPLPVELSFFRPVLENGEIVIRWTTESELDNAGFNILRSDTWNGEFKQVNTKLIQGKGTTGERSTYKWVDETAKPNAVYYYQIEDVSFAGERQTLATTKLKGLISAKNKATTTWGDLKSQD